MSEGGAVTGKLVLVVCSNMQFRVQNQRIITKFSSYTCPLTLNKNFGTIGNNRFNIIIKKHDKSLHTLHNSMNETFHSNVIQTRFGSSMDNNPTSSYRRMLFGHNMLTKCRMTTNRAVGYSLSENSIFHKVTDNKIVVYFQLTVHMGPHFCDTVQARYIALAPAAKHNLE